MAYSELKKLKKVEANENERFFIRYLVVGNDLFAVETYRSLVAKHGEENVRLLTSVEITKELLRVKGPSTIRGEQNISYIERNAEELITFKSDKMSRFYKELKFKKFGGRSKSETLLWGEEYYTTPKITIDLEKKFPILSDEELVKEINNKAVKNYIRSVNRVLANDLVDNASYEVECANGKMFACEKLFWSLGPSQFLHFFEAKNKLSDGFIEFCESTQTPSALYIRYIFDKPICEKTYTMFVPLSYTHEWGHFIGDFEEKEGKQTVEFVHFIDKNNTTDEEISRKIKLLKKNIEKIFPDSKNISSQEFITITDETMSLKIDDTLYETLKGEHTNLTFISFNAPLVVSADKNEECADSSESVSHLVRAMKVQSELANIL
ncbi:hypothetical protein M899_1326 [Bacteriovorax sp. BSW11_IV]|uniref:hypothetical protein n=1 Tax=Bacteriovorax sp. BSW11_IV TaxID=1353529 RepID=UPI00038A555B|nr:hypothetical protein [Bacteriovorax sp. BSW11_IV]EQC45770.1 hypothetical protein M899_1326 [Bacteriovorax sp. BSW11_IV]